MRLLRALAALALLVTAACGGGDGGILGIGGGGGNGSIQGQVTSDGAGLGGVLVVLINRDTTQTDGNGAYRFSAVPAGTHAVSVLVPVGFVLAAGEEANRTAVVAGRGAATVNWRLQRSVGADAARAPGLRRQAAR